MFLCLSAVSASDINETTDTLTTNLDESNDAISVDEKNTAAEVNSQATVSTSYKTSSGEIFAKNDKYDFQLLGEDGKGLANKSVQVTFNGKTANSTTNDNGHIYFTLNAKGTYLISFLFNENGYAPVSFSKKLTIVDSSKTTITGSNYNAYVGLKNQFSVVLSANGVKLPNQKVKFKIVGKTYTRYTDANGKATLDINLKAKTYPITYSFDGSSKLKSSKGSAKVIVKKGSPTKIVRMNSVTYHHKTSAPFIVKYKDVRGNAIPYQSIIFKFGKKTYKMKTDKEGLVKFYIKLNKGTYKFSVYSYNTAKYKSSSNSYTIKVKAISKLKNNGFWLFGSDMKKVNLNTMAKNGVNNIFLNSYAVTLYGKNAVASFATQAKSLGIKIHIWMQVFNDGDWITPVNKDGSFKYSLYNSIIKDAKDYASIDGVAGIHFDYLRFPGTAYKYTNGVAAINYFTKQACDALHKQNSALILSAAVMAEPSANKYYYGQDIPTLSKYLDVIVPMVYKGNYKASSNWIKTTTEALVKQSKGAEIWTGLQGYYSDSNVKKLPASSLIADADNAGYGGATGVIIFRYSLFNMINFNEL